MEAFDHSMLQPEARQSPRNCPRKQRSYANRRCMSNRYFGTMKKSRQVLVDRQLTASYGNLGTYSATVEPSGRHADQRLMRSKKPGKTVIMVGANKPEPNLEKEMEARGIRLRWARTIKNAAGLLSAVCDRPIVIAELALSDGNWRDVVEQVRCIDSSIPVLLVSSTSTAELWWDALECGIEDILPTPLSASSLCEYLGKHCQAME
jgi:PleD family two-component response regulator